MIGIHNHCAAVFIGLSLPAFWTKSIPAIRRPSISIFLALKSADFVRVIFTCAKFPIVENTLWFFYDDYQAFPEHQL